MHAVNSPPAAALQFSVTENGYHLKVNADLSPFFSPPKAILIFNSEAVDVTPLAEGLPSMLEALGSIPSII